MPDKPEPLSDEEITAIWNRFIGQPYDGRTLSAIIAHTAQAVAELRMRSSVYPRWIGNGKMTEAQASREINAMGAVLATLERVASEQRPGLFGSAAREKPAC